MLPRAYHVLDVIRYRGRYYASTGSVPPGQRAFRGDAPGALHVASDDLSRWTYEVDYPFPFQDGVWRLGFMVRFKGRLYAGIQDYAGREPNDYVYFAPAAGSKALTRADVHGVRVSAQGASATLRWFADSGRLYWIARDRTGVHLRVTEDGDGWKKIALPPEGGHPTDIKRFRGALVVLTERRLYRLDGETAVTLATTTAKKSPFALTDIFCAAPLGIYDNELYAGGQRDGALYRLVPTPAQEAPR